MEVAMGILPVLLLLILGLLTLVPYACATNGDTLIGVAPASRAMGGAGVAAPQDAISAIFANPAAICMGPYCPGSQTVFAATLYDPTVRATVVSPAGTFSVKSGMQPFIIPSVGLITPLTDRLRFGIGAFGISGMGVDYRNSGITLNPATPGDGDVYTQLQILKFAPNMAYLVTPNFSVGASLHLLYGSLDLGQGTAHNYAFGGQVGAIYKAGPVSLGVNYTTPEKMDHRNVSDFGSPPVKKSLTLESPQNVSFGAAWRPADRLLVEADVKWLNWADADGYRDFDWADQWVYAVGVQYKDPHGICLRGGYNYGKNPVKAHDGFNPAGTTLLQGNAVPTTLYEYLRIVGFPAIAEHHFTASIGYRFSDTFEGHVGYMYSLNKKVAETSAGGTFGFASELREVSYDLGLVWNFF
jgi:long-chain fatty acid transport protein